MQHQVQTHSQRQNFYLIQQKLQLLNIMHLTTNALEEHIQTIVDENPALETLSENENTGNDEMENQDLAEKENYSLTESYNQDEDYPDYRTYVNNQPEIKEHSGSLMIAQSGFQEQLKSQLKEFNVNTSLIPHLHYLIDSLEEDGILRRSLEDLSDDYSFSEGNLISEVTLLKCLEIIQQLDPAGVGARNLQECLLLQLKRKKNASSSQKNALLILETRFKELTTKNFSKIAKDLNISNEELRESLQVITHLSPRPVFDNSKSDSHSLAIIPEFILTVNDGEIEISLTSNTSNILKVNKHFEEYCQGKNQRNSDVRRNFPELTFYRKKVEEARWFIDALQQREKTLMDIMKAIATLQHEYFISGDSKDLHPMILQNIADLVGYDLSTISRVTSNKYVQTPFGNVLLKDVFSNAMVNEEGESISAEEIKQTIQEIIEQEPKLAPLNDFDIVKKLQEKGYTIARRTVVKYRAALNIANARMRKVIA